MEFSMPLLPRIRNKIPVTRPSSNRHCSDWQPIIPQDDKYFLYNDKPITHSKSKPHASNPVLTTKTTKLMYTHLQQCISLFLPATRRKLGLAKTEFSIEFCPSLTFSIRGIHSRQLKQFDDPVYYISFGGDKSVSESIGRYHTQGILASPTPAI